MKEAKAFAINQGCVTARPLQSFQRMASYVTIVTISILFSFFLCFFHYLIVNCFHICIHWPAYRQVEESSKQSHPSIHDEEMLTTGIIFFVWLPCGGIVHMHLLLSRISLGIFHYVQWRPILKLSHCYYCTIRTYLGRVQWCARWIWLWSHQC